MAIHCAESPAERELLARGEGPLWRMLRRLGKWPHGAPVPGAGPLDVLDRAGLLRPQTLLVHGNDLRPRELDRVRERGCVMVFCPGSHRFFRYPKYPLREILRRRIPLGLGTDSLASNEDLSMPREMAIVRESFPQIAPEIIFEMATLGGARALGWERRIGSLHPGKEADLAVIGVRVGRKRRPILEEITSARPDTLFAYIGGQQAFPPSRRVL